ncbi:MAG: ABC transporter ATP-binding protein [Candidatus Omnitrophica bacterium]|nr:ABC transporter ATP-binding protein [Candidatus Omnitrophota bacterium]MDD5660854.1 ABC transporter ATP-binding protein [Candidatus Omnitrophota bacterium]
MSASPFSNNSKTLKFIFSYRRQILILFLFSLISSSFPLVAPYISKLFIDKVFVDKDFSKFWNLSILGVGLFVLTMFVKGISDIVKNRIAIKLRFNLSNKFIKKLYSLDLGFFQSRSVGENIYRLSDTESIINFSTEQCPALLVDIIKLPIILGIAFLINLPMTVSLLILSPLFILQSVYLQKKLKPIYAQIWDYSSRLSKEVAEAFSRISVIKLLGLETYKKHSYLRSLIKNIRWKIKSFRWFVIGSLSASFLSQVVYGAITLYGGWLIINSRLTLGSYTAVMLYLTQLGGLLQSLGHRFEYITQDIVSIEKFVEVMENSPKIKDAPEAKSLSCIKGGIAFKGVWFGYQKENPVFEGVNFNIPPASWVSIAGPSGSGKSTLANLMLRLYEPWQGSVLFDGIDLKSIKLKSLWALVSIATQQPFLFDQSIGENIAYGLKNKGKNCIEEAAKAAAIHNIVIALPHGYDTRIGEDACFLSYGMKQKIAIARAIMRRPDILILDEAFASVDSLAEEEIISRLKKISDIKTVILVSHRLSTVLSADFTLFIKGPREIIMDSPGQLLKKEEGFRSLFAEQLQAKIS